MKKNFKITYLLCLTYLGMAFSVQAQQLPSLTKKQDNPMISLRKAEDRGLGQHAWLLSRHTFSFANYYDPKYMGFRSLRVINEDKIQGGKGFDAHSHDNMEIISYVLEGALRHKDSVGNETVIRPGEIQRMSAGTGVVHSEYNNEKDKETHFYQIWITPSKKGSAPSYAQKSFQDALKNNKMVLVVSNSGRDGSISIDQDADIFLSCIKKDESLLFTPKDNRHIWIQMMKGKMQVNGELLAAGDGLSSENEQLSFLAQEDAEFMLFDLK